MPISKKSYGSFLHMLSCRSSLSVCMYLGWTLFCPVLMIKSISFPHHSAPLAYQTSPPLPKEVVIMTPMTPSLRLSSAEWPAFWQRYLTWLGGSYLFLAVLDLQRRSQGSKSQIPIFNTSCANICWCTGLQNPSIPPSALLLQQQNQGETNGHPYPWPSLQRHNHS